MQFLEDMTRAKVATWRSDVTLVNGIRCPLRPIDVIVKKLNDFFIRDSGKQEQALLFLFENRLLWIISERKRTCSQNRVWIILAIANQQLRARVHCRSCRGQL